MLSIIRAKRIFGLALPIIGGMVSQNVLNLIDTAMVGSLGDPALAAVGLGGFATFMCMALVIGVSTGVQATAARRKGEGKYSETAHPLNTGIVLVTVVAIPMSIILYQAVPYFYPYLNNDPDVMAGGIPYLQIRTLAIVFVGINFAFRGYWNAVDMSKLYMTTLVVMHLTNIFLNWVLIFGNLGAPQLGVAGAAWATAISTVFGTTTYILLGLKYALDHGFMHSRPKWPEILRLARLSIPSSIQQFFFAAGFTAMFWIIGKVGTSELSAANVLINLTLVAILPGLAFGLAASTLVGQSLGKNEPENAFRWGWDVSKVGVITLGCLALPMWLAPELILGIFLKNQETLEMAIFPLRLTGITIALEGISMVLMNSLLGAGDAKPVMYVSVALQWLIFLPAAYLIGPVAGMGLTAIWIAHIAYRMLQGIIFVALWQKGNWKTAEV